MNYNSKNAGKNELQVQKIEQKHDKIMSECQKINNSDLWKNFIEINEDLLWLKNIKTRYGRTRDIIAEILDVSRTQVGKMQTIEKYAIDEIKEAVNKGRVSICSAKIISKLNKEEQEKIISEISLTKMKPKEIEQFIESQVKHDKL